MNDTDLNLFGDPTPLRLPLPDDTRNALIERGIEPPEFVLLLLQQATPREVQHLAAVKMSPPKTGPEATAWMASLLMRRAAEGTDERVVRELVNDMTPAAITLFTFAYTEGRLPDPKEQERLMEAMRKELLKLQSPLAAKSPALGRSSRTSTTSTKKNSKTSPRTTSRT